MFWYWNIVPIQKQGEHRICLSINNKKDNEQSSIAIACDKDKETDYFIINFDDTDSADYIDAKMRNYTQEEIKFKKGDIILQGRTQQYINGRILKIVVDDIGRHTQRISQQGKKLKSRGGQFGTQDKKD